MSHLLASAQTFILNNARLLERRLFAYLFANGTKQPVIAALLAYQNEDGGFGNALEPDKRTATSQPIDQEVALRVLDDVGFDAGIALRVDCGTEDPFYPATRDYVATLTPKPAGSFQEGGHDVDYWRRIAPGQLAFIGRHLTV